MNFQFVFPSRQRLNALVLSLVGLLLICTVGRPWIFLDIGLYQPYDEKRLLEIGLFLAFALIFTTTPQARAAWLTTLDELPGLARRALGAILVLGLLSVSLSANPGQASFEIALFVLGMFMALTMARIRRELGVDFDQRFMSFIVASAFIYLFFFLLVYFNAFSDATTVPEEFIDDVKSLMVFPSFSNRRFLDQYLTWTLPLIVVPFALVRFRWAMSKVMLYLIAAGWWALFFSGDGRGKVLGVIISVAGVVAIYRKTARPWLSLQALAAAGGLVLFWLIFVLAAPDSAQPLIRAGSSGRIELLRHGMELTAQNPWVGAGPLHFSCCGEIKSAHPHNALVQWAAEWGLPSTALVFGLLVAGFVAWVRRSKEVLRLDPTAERRVLLPALTASCLAAATHAMFSGIIVMPLSQVMMIAIGGWMLGIFQGPVAEGSVGLQPGRRKSGAFVVLVLAAAAALATHAWRDLPDVMSVTAESSERPISQGPRIWSFGVMGPAI